ncbi:flavin reductase family protein [Micromonospora chersina]|uniref:flavin reductase family protein n=1 Tax=Micromonospora chersina TaxID=47854 RepID=UPI0037135C64
MRSGPIAGVPVSHQDFRDLMGSFPTGVAVVAAIRPDGRPIGMTCSSVCSVSLTPPTLLACLRVGSSTLDAILARSCFTVNLLHADAQPAAELFASAAPDRFERVVWDLEPDGAGPHLIRDAHRVADCRLSGTAPVGDHQIIFGEVVRVSMRVAGRPLLYGLRRYSAWPDGDRRDGRNGRPA